MKKIRLLALTTLLGSVSAYADVVNFSTFVSGASINAVEGVHDTISFAYAGNKFVGTVYNGAAGGFALQLYQTDLNGGNVAKFGNPLPSGSGEIVLGSSQGQGGFGNGDVFAGANGTIYHYANGGGAPTVFSTPGGGTIRGIQFDNAGGLYGGRMLVTTSSGNVYAITSAGVATLLASTGEDTEGMDIATANWGPYAGQLLVASENSGRLRFISPTGVITNVDSAPGVHITVVEAEVAAFVPLNFGASGNPLEGFYAANYAVDVQKSTGDFSGLLGHALITSEEGSNSRVWDLTYNSGTGFFVLNGTPVGHLPNQSEDGFFLTADKIAASTPEPSSIVLLSSLMLGVGHMLRRRLRG